ELVPQGFLSPHALLAGYGMGQAVPGPLFTFASYLGTILAGLTDAVVGTVHTLLHCFLLGVDAVHFLSERIKRPCFPEVLMGVNASVVGILLAAFYDPVIKSSISDGSDFALALILFALLNVWKAPAWLIVIIGILGGYIFHVFGF